MLERVSRSCLVRRKRDKSKSARSSVSLVMAEDAFAFESTDFKGT